MLERELRELGPKVAAALDRNGFHAGRFCDLAHGLLAREQLNEVEGSVEELGPRDLAALPSRDSAEGRACVAAGEALLREGRCALVLLAGGMATRMGGVVKALVEALDGATFLDLRLAEQDALARRFGARPPLWLMTSEATHEALAAALGERFDGRGVAMFRQRWFPRLTSDGRIFRDHQGEPSLHAPGHGDLPEALAESGLLRRFVAGGGRSLMIANIDNLGATLDPLVVGWHALSGTSLTCEVVEKRGVDRGGVPVRWNGRPVVLEEFRLPKGFDASRVGVFNANTFHVDAEALVAPSFPWTHFVVEKKVGERATVQLERLLGELTSFLDARFLLVPREGADSRFLPVKDVDELGAQRRHIEQVLTARGILPRGAR